MSALLLVVGIAAAIIGVVHVHQAHIDRNRVHTAVGAIVVLLGVALAITGTQL